MCDLYKLLLDLPDEKIAGETFNCGYQNQSIMEIARIAKKIVYVNALPHNLEKNLGRGGVPAGKNRLKP